MSFKGTCYGKENWGHWKLLLIGLELLALRVKKVAWKFGSLILLVLSNVCLLWREECVGFCACITFFVPPWNGHSPNEGLCPYSPLGSYFCHSSFFPWACWPYWPTGLIISFIGLSRPTYFIFTSYSSCGPVGCHSCHVDPLGLLPLSLDFLGRLTSSLLLILPMGLLAVIPTMFGPLGLLTCFYHSYFLFPSTSLIVGLLLSLGLSSKVGINTHINL